jgi:hypothetical protein
MANHGLIYYLRPRGIAMTLPATDRHTLKLADEFVEEAERIRDRRIIKYFPLGSWVTTNTEESVRGRVYEVKGGMVYFRNGNSEFFAEHGDVEPSPPPVKKITQPKMEGKKVCHKKK